MRRAMQWVWPWLLLSAAVQAQSFAGAWSSEVGSMTLTQQGARVSGRASVSGVSGTLSGTTKGTRVSGTYAAEGEEGTFQAELQGDTLFVAFDDGAPLPFRRAGGGGRAPAPAASATAVGEPAPRVSAAGGAEVRVEAEGWAARAPAQWRFRVEGPRVLFGSDTEAGLIVASFREGATLEEMQQAATQGFTDSGLLLRPVGAPQPLEVQGARGVAVDMQTTAQDGTALRARAAGVIGARGGVALLGLTTPAKFAALRARVDQVAKSVAFFAPKVPAGAHLLRGALCHHSGGSVASWTRRYTFDGRGHVTTGSEMVAGGQFSDGLGNSTGAWGATSGNQYSAGSGGTYAVQGDAVTLRLGGETYTCAVAFRQQGGQITELKCGDRLYGAALCE